MKVHVEGEAGEAASDPDAMVTPEGGQTYQGGHTAHVGQLFFDDAISDEVFETEAYARSSDDGKIANDEDNIYGDHGDEPGFLLALTGSVDEGFTGTITVGVDPAAVAVEGMAGQIVIAQPGVVFAERQRLHGLPLARKLE